MPRHRDAREFLWHSLVPFQQRLERPRLGLLAREGGRRLQEADEADRADLVGSHEQPVLEGGPPRDGDEPFDPGAASRHRPLARGGATVGRATLPGKEERVREECSIRERRATSCIHGRQPRRRDLRGVSGDSGSGTTSGGATVWKPTCYAFTVRSECNQERRGAGTARLQR